MAGIDRLIFAALNHLLQGETWAQDRLRPFAGARVLIEAGPIAFGLLIDERGFFSSGDNAKQADVTLTLPADTAVKFIVDRQNLFAAVKLSGSADIAESLAFVFRNLRWDVESDLAGLIGDIPARRLTMLGAGFSGHLQEGAKRLAENLVEYATEDSLLLVPQRDIDVFCSEVNELRDGLARLEKKIARL
ncbi:SCP2 domain-containing protein [Azonexus sp. IMCC34842]|uniref:ubiquinone biosynthesis accessory factor UbiJ n=1 Tax=Azonexus sp. IMCC34842 TaxID=3420950 RepID=UPI003D0E49C3